MKLTGKSVLITGASSGIGADLAREFAQQGAHVVLVARRKERLQDLVDEISAGGGRAIAVQGDVTQDGSMEEAVRMGLLMFGKLDIVIANAGFGVADRLSELTLEDYRRQFETNVFGVLRTGYAAFEALKRTAGQFVIIGSVAGYVALPGSSPYSMSKFAVRALAEALNHEWRPAGIRVTHIAPGFVVSEIQQVDNQGVLHAKSSNEAPSWLHMPTRQAARAIVKAIKRKKSESVITQHGKLIVFFQRHFPGLVRAVLRLSNLQGRAEPKSGNHDAPAGFQKE